MAIELIPLATATLKVGQPIKLGDVGIGTRLVAEILSAEWDGDRIKAKQIGTAAADWPLIGTDGVGRLDVRSTLQTHDGAVIYVRYEGRSTSGADGSTLYTSPLFETASPEYAWLNKIQAVAKGRITPGAQTLVYEIYEVR
ncbi:MAG: DUF3237 domain-containing protein [Spongiibacteraceae bacterium]